VLLGSLQQRTVIEKIKTNSKVMKTNVQKNIGSLCSSNNNNNNNNNNQNRLWGLLTFPLEISRFCHPGESSASMVAKSLISA